MRRIGALLLLALAACPAATSAPSAKRLHGYGLSLALPSGWHGLVSSGELQAADFALPRRALGSAARVRVRRGHVHLIVWDYGPSVPYLAATFRPARAPLAIGRHDVLAGPPEGFSSRDVYAVLAVTLGEEQLQVVADLGPKPLRADALGHANRVLRALGVQPPRVLPVRHRRLAADGVALRLPPGWSGRVELPANRQAAELVVRAHRGSARFVLLETPGAGAAYAKLPIALTRESVFRRHGLALARRVFFTAGRTFDVTVTLPSPGALADANRLLGTLTAAPRPWTFRSCELALRVPGTWHAAINPRSGCYPVIILRGPRVRLVLTELRAKDHPSGRVLRRSGRRFEAEVTPRSAERQAGAVLASLRARPRR